MVKHLVEIRIHDHATPFFRAAQDLIRNCAEQVPSPPPVEAVVSRTMQPREGLASCEIMPSPAYLMWLAHVIQRDIEARG